jgi:hypothetical protein
MGILWALYSWNIDGVDNFIQPMLCGITPRVVYGTPLRRAKHHKRAPQFTRSNPVKVLIGSMFIRNQRDRCVEWEF